MTNQKLLTVLSAAILFALTFVVMQSCQKTTELPKSGTTELDEEYKTIVEHIQDFEKKMEFYRDNPGLKSSEKEYVLDAILDWESTLNFNYCYSYLDISEIKIYDTTIAIPKDINDSMTMADVSDRYYNAVLSSVQTHYYVNAPFANQKLLAVDLEPTEDFQSVVVSIWIGNDTPGMLHPEYDWIYGQTEGTCDNHFYYGESDAAKQAAIHTRTTFYEAPPENKRWFFPNPTTITATPLDDENGVLIYLNHADDVVDNYLDYLIYYADSEVDPPSLDSGVRCVEASPELNFYKQSYIDLTQGWLTGDIKFKECEYNGYNMGTYLLHELKTEIGNRFVTDIALIDLPPIED